MEETNNNQSSHFSRCYFFSSPRAHSALLYPPYTPLTFFIPLFYYSRAGTSACVCLWWYLLLSSYTYEKQKSKLANLPSNKFIRLLRWENVAGLIDICTGSTSDTETWGRRLLSTTRGLIALSVLLRALGLTGKRRKPTRDTFRVRHQRCRGEERHCSSTTFYLHKPL